MEQDHRWIPARTRVWKCFLQTYGLEFNGHAALGMTWPLVSLLECRRVPVMRYVGAPLEGRENSPTYIEVFRPRRFRCRLSLAPYRKAVRGWLRSKFRRV